jgi:hypothetical protein
MHLVSNIEEKDDGIKGKIHQSKKDNLQEGGYYR